MSTFSYIAVDTKGTSIKGSVEASDRSSVISSLTAKQLRPISVKEVSEAKKGTLPLPKFLGSGKVKSDDLVIFTRQLATMVNAGVPLLRAIQSLQTHSESEALKNVVNGIYKDVQSGLPLADALEKYPDTFNDVYVNMVRAGEAAGILDDILKRLATQQEKSSAMKKKIKSAMTYPMVLVVITIGAFFGLMIFVIPQIGKIIQDLGGPDAKLPLLTTIMLGISHFMVSFWYILIPILVGGVYGLLRFLKTPKGKHIFHRLVLKMPGVKTIVVKVAVARFSRIFSALIGAGVSVLESLEVTARAVGNDVYEQAIINAGEEVKNGAQLSEVIGSNPIFPPIVAQMLAVGEETGQTDQVLVKIADFYEEEVDAAIDGMSSIIEPVMIVFMGGMVGVIAASVMQPIAGLASSIKG